MEKHLSKAPYGYYDRFAQYPIKKLITDYYQIELNLINDVKDNVTVLLKEAGYVKKAGYENEGDLYLKNNMIYRVDISMVKGERTLLVKIDTTPSNHKIRTMEAQINHFGLFRKILLLSSPRLPIYLTTKILDILKAQILEAYIALEKSLINNYEDLSRYVFRNLYGCLETHLAVTNKPHLFGRIWFAIADEKLLFFYFDIATLRKVIEHYKNKNNQDSSLSPFELTIWIMSQPLPFAKTLSFESLKQHKPKSLSWSKVRYMGDAPRTLLAEILLYSSDEYTTYVCCECRGYYLAISFPTPIAKEILPELETLKESLKIHFQNGLKHWSPYFKIVKNLSQITEPLELASVAGTIFGRAAAEFLKSWIVR